LIFLPAISSPAQTNPVPFLTLAISVDNFSAGIATAAFIAYLSSLTSSNYSATQYALLSSIMLLFAKFIAGFSGLYVDPFGYINFFIAASLIGFPVLLLVVLVNRSQNQVAAEAASSDGSSNVLIDVPIDVDKPPR
jgi:PAT family beta-lactamase induction signal transducer AmpG